MNYKALTKSPRLLIFIALIALAITTLSAGLSSKQFHAVNSLQKANLDVPSQANISQSISSANLQSQVPNNIISNDQQPQYSGLVNKIQPKVPEVITPPTPIQQTPQIPSNPGTNMPSIPGSPASSGSNTAIINVDPPSSPINSTTIYPKFRIQPLPLIEPGDVLPDQSSPNLHK